MNEERYKGKRKLIRAVETKDSAVETKEDVVTMASPGKKSLEERNRTKNGIFEKRRLIDSSILLCNNDLTSMDGLMKHWMPFLRILWV